MAEAPLLAIENLSVQLGKKVILQDVSFEIKAGDWVSVIGPNGAGKSTLFKTLLGLAPVSAGAIRLLGKSLQQISPRDRARVMGYVPQVAEQGLTCTVEEFIMMGRYPYLSAFASPGAEDRQIVDQVLALTDTVSFRHRLMDSLSGGERQKVFIAGALAQQPRLLLLDEPASYLDPRNELDIQELLQRINRETGMAIVMVSHHLNSVLRYSQLVVGLKAGQLLFDGSPQTLLESNILQDLFDVEFQVLTAAGQSFPVIVPDRVMS